MKIVCFEPPYSNYLNDLANQVEQQLQAKVLKECISFHKSDMIYLPDFLHIKLNIPHNFIINEDLNALRNLANINGNIESDNLLNSMSACYSAIDTYIKNNKSALFWFYNDLRWTHSFAINICKKYNCSFFVFERGVFRPHSTTMDSNGVNANSAFRNLSYNEQIVENTSSKGDFFKARTERASKLKFSKYYISKKIQSYFVDKHIRIVLNSSVRKSFTDYLKLAIRQNKKTTEDKLDISEPYVFIPLQLSNDTQTLINSNFPSTQAFIDRVVEDYLTSTVNSKVKLVFKIHPFDIASYKFPDFSSVSNLDTNYLIQHCSSCITINSTVGFEAMFSKAVICLGESFYTEHGGIYKLNSKENIFDVDTSRIASNNYQQFVLNHYQVPGSIFNYTDEDLKFTATKIISKIKETTCF